MPVQVATIAPGVDGGEAMIRILDDLLNDTGSGRGQAIAAVAPDQPADVILQPDQPLEDPQTSLILLTSGSTGAPKGVCLSRDNVLAAALAVEHRHRDVARSPRILALPATSAAGVGVVARALIANAAIVMLPSIGGGERFTPELFNAVAEPWLDQHPVVSLVPTQLALLLADETTRPKLHMLGRVLLGGAPPPAALLTSAADAGVDVTVTYGMTETCGGCVHDGQALEGVAYQINADGVIVLDGPMIASGYRLQPEATAAAFRPEGFITADQGVIENHRLRVLGRLDDVVQVRGTNVSVAAIDDILASDLQVAAAASVAQPDPVEGHLILTILVAAKPLAATELARLRALVRQQLGSAAVPRVIEQVNALPTLPNGKIDRLSILARHAQKSTR